MKAFNQNDNIRIGLSDAAVAFGEANELHKIKINLYDTLKLDNEKIKNGVTVIFTMYPSKFYLISIFLFQVNAYKRFERINMYIDIHFLCIDS